MARSADLVGLIPASCSSGHGFAPPFLQTSITGLALGLRYTSPPSGCDRDFHPASTCACTAHHKKTAACFHAAVITIITSPGCESFNKLLRISSASFSFELCFLISSAEYHSIILFL